MLKTADWFDDYAKHILDWLDDYAKHILDWLDDYAKHILDWLDDYAKHILINTVPPFLEDFFLLIIFTVYQIRSHVSFFFLQQQNIRIKYLYIQREIKI
ncbi:hypothetical protein CHS0354_001570 [Potamilus streckersoni]|uniref:Uncharacterized protein n=1 Tax=Potamilus streckersoni TaxID=2493646 RepID=A0AAE0SJ69_9BIVA|nr:hypothetical protein CHS0354_001570 [Potamilus streckersoni]